LLIIISSQVVHRLVRLPHEDGRALIEANVDTGPITRVGHRRTTFGHEIERNCMQGRPPLLRRAYHLYGREERPLILQSPCIFSCREPSRQAVKTGARLAKKALMPSSRSGPVKTRWLSVKVRLIASCVVWVRESGTPARMRLSERAGRSARISAR